MTDPLPRLRAELLQRLDADGTITELLDAFGDPGGRDLIRVVTAVVGEDLDAVLVAAAGLVGDMARAVLLFTPYGWAPSEQMVPEVYQRALAAYDRTGVEAAEAVLVEGWNEKNRLFYLLNTAQRLGGDDEQMQQVAAQRLDLLRKALRHHQQGSFEASVPIVLAQVDGIVHDFTGKSLFTPKNNTVADRSTVLGMSSTLSVLRKVYGQSVRTTTSSGGSSRHAIMHGRELGYATLENSTKAFVLLLAVLAWAEPRAREEAGRRRAEREAEHAGSTHVDSEGRRLDRRGFDDAKNALRKVSTRQMAEFNREGRYRSDLDAMFPGDFGDQWLHGRDRVRLCTSPDRRSWWATYATHTGFVFGLGAADGSWVEHMYAGLGFPTGGPNDAPGWKDALSADTPPDW